MLLSTFDLTSSTLCLHYGLHITCFVFEMAFAGHAISFSSTPIILTVKLSSKNYLFWYASVEFWFRGQGYRDHLEKGGSDIPIENKSQWQKLDFQLSCPMF